MLSAGDLDRRIIIEARAVTGTDPTYGTPVYGWATHAEVWAQVRDVLPSRAESLDDSVSISRRPARIRIRYREGITSDMRIKFGDRTLLIVSGPAELGRREALELMAEELSTEGQEP